jgi:hypothetical protein
MKLSLMRSLDILIKLFPVCMLVAFTGCVTDGGVVQKAISQQSSSDSLKTDLPSYNEVITEKAVTKKGLLNVHKVEDDWFFEIPDSLLNRDMLVVNRLSKAPIDNQPEDRGSINSMIGYAGDRINKTLIRLEKGPDQKLFIRAISYSVIPDSSSSMYQSVLNSNTQPIVHALDIETVGKDSSLVVEMSDLMVGDDPLFSFGSDVKNQMNLTRLKKDRTYVNEIRSFPQNTEIRTVRTYERNLSNKDEIGVPRLEPSQGIPASAEISTLQINSSIILLPEKPMNPRFYDERVGYFATGYRDYNANPQGVEETYMVTRWDLKPKKEDRKRYKLGKLVEPEEPIIFYIDPATPEKWMPYLKQGVDVWQKAFEKAGFKNAIMAKEAPEEDSTWSLMDARYSAIVYKASSIANASGPHINDPRSGEILESHINWYHNVMELARNWYMVQAAPSDTAARNAMFSEELMGKLIQFIVAHEVGHALGLRHNMGASYATPVEKLRDRQWLAENGHTSSIMDYARFNYVAQPEDDIDRSGLFPRINDYDFWAIEWGYKRFPGKAKEEKKDTLAKLTTQKVSNPRLRFISGEEGRADPRAQTEDLGDNAMKAGAYGIENLKYIVPKLSDWVAKEGDDYNTLRDVYQEVVSQYLKYILHVIENIGGIYHTPKLAGQQGNAYEITPESQQKEAMLFVTEYAFQKPEWLFEKNILNNVWSPENELAPQISNFVMDELYDSKRLSRLSSSASRNGEDNVYTLVEYMQDIQKALWSELETDMGVSSYRRTLQNAYINKMGELSMPFQSSSGGLLSNILSPSTDLSETDIPSVARYLLQSLKKDVSVAIPKTEDRMTRIHLENVKHKIGKILEQEA